MFLFRGEMSGLATCTDDCDFRHLGSPYSLSDLRILRLTIRFLATDDLLMRGSANMRSS